MTVADIFFSHAQLRRDAPAIRRDGAVLTFGDLAERIARVANALAGRGVGAGANVGLTMKDGVGTVVEMAAVWALGATVTPLDFRTPDPEMERLVKEFGVAFLMTDKRREIAGAVQIARDADWRAEVDRSSATPPAAPEAPGPAVISLTSGTTGRPIGIVLTQRELVIRIAQYSRVNLRPDTVFACAGLMSFSAVRNHVLGFLCAAKPILFYPPLIDASEFIERLNADGATNTFAVPTMVRAMLAQASGAGAPVLPQVGGLFCGGAEMTVEEKLGAFERLSPGFRHSFASSVTGTCSLLEGEDLRARPETDGRIDDGVRIEIVDTEDRPLPEGEIGAMRVRSPAMASSVVGGAGRTQGDRLKAGWAYTGDLASVAGGFLSIRGRTGDAIVRGGANVYPGEIEHALMRLPGVRECAVIGVASEREGQEIAAFVAAPGLTESELVAHCRASLAPDKRPRRFHFVESLPRNVNGKVLKRELAAS